MATRWLARIAMDVAAYTNIVNLGEISLANISALTGLWIWLLY
jgi:hypothetical protein